MPPVSSDTVQDQSSAPTSSAAASGRPTRAVIDLSAIEHNFREVARRAEGRKVLAVIKAQAYGHGAVPVARRLVALGADMLGVALVEEGKELRDAGIAAPVVLMGPMFPEQAESAARLNLTPAVYSMPVALALSEAGRKLGIRIAVHAKIDTGMGRIGVAPGEAARFVAALRGLSGIEVTGLMTHFADADLRDKRFASEQMDRFDALLRELDALGVDLPVRHAANSAAVLDFRRALFTMVRPGLMLYGYSPLEQAAGGPDLRPALSFVTRVAFLKKVPAGVPISYGRTFVTKRESIIATLPVGYADGFSRALSNRGEALVRGRRAPVAGRVCMDMCMIDVTEIPGVREGDEVVLIGSQSGERITAGDIAAKTGTIPYEVLCGIGSRVPRIYYESA